MIIKNKKYVIVTKEFPLQFLGQEFRSDEIEYAEFYDSEKEAQGYVNGCLDEPEEFQVLEVKVSYEF